MPIHELLNVDDFEAQARATLDRATYDYCAGGAGDETTLRANRAAFDAVALRPRVLVDVEHLDLTTELLQQRRAWPVLLAPTALNRLCHVDGELAAARAAQRTGTGFVISTFSSCRLEEIAAACPATWFQTYVFRDRGLTRDLVQRAEAAGCEALVVTVDTPRLGRRERDIRNRFTLPDHVTAANLVAGDAASRADLSLLQQLPDPSLSWPALEWLRGITSLPILLKGVLTGEDAALAIVHGAAGIIVSNHGGRQLDGAVATLDALPEIVAAVHDAVPVLLDGGVRRGADVLKALALGARAVLVGRPYLWGLAVAGESGVERILALLQEELRAAMQLTGCPRAAAADSSLARRRQR